MSAVRVSFAQKIMVTPTPVPDDSALARRVVWALAAAKLVLHLAFIRGYGIFRDELYYLDTARHLE